MRVFVAIVGILDELDDRVGTANLRLTVITEQTGAPQPCLTRKHFDSITAEALLNPPAIENDRLGGTRAENGGQDTGGEV